MLIWRERELAGSGKHGNAERGTGTHIREILGHEVGLWAEKRNLSHGLHMGFLKGWPCVGSLKDLLQLLNIYIFQLLNIHIYISSAFIYIYIYIYIYIMPLLANNYIPIESLIDVDRIDSFHYFINLQI
jgi:hypothetical protein